MNINNVITWFDIPTLDFDRAVKFYSEILGQPIQVDDYLDKKLGFFPMDGETGIGGNIMPPDDSFKPATGGVRIYLNCVGKLDEVISRVEKSGGKILRSKVGIGDPGYIAIIKDTEGNHIGLHSTK